MSKILKKMVSNIARFWSKIYSYEFDQIIKKKKDIIFTLWIENFLGSIGKNCLIQYPTRLWGGGGKYIKIGNNTIIQSHCILGCWIKYAGIEYTPSLTIGNNCNIGEHTHISTINKITIGDGLLTGRYVYIGDNSHGDLSWKEADIHPIRRRLKSKGPILIGNNVWIGDKVTILSGVTIGDNVIIGANSVVTHDITSNCVAAGMPAKIIKQLK